MHNPYTDELEACRDARAVARCLLEKALGFCGAPMGHVQLLDRRSDVLEIAAQQGFTREFLDVIAQAGAPVSARALLLREPVAIEDVEADPGRLSVHAGIFARAGVRTIQSIPLAAKDGAAVGMLSAHFPRPTCLCAAELVTMRRFASLAANRIALLREPGAPRRPSKANLEAWSKSGFKSKM